MRYLVFGIFLLNSFYAHSNNDTLYIAKQSAEIGFTNASFCSFHSSTDFSRNNTAIKINEGESLIITIINLDSLVHDFTIDNVIESNNIVQGFDTLTVQVDEIPNGTFRYYSSVNYGHLLGASGVLQVGYEEYERYCWNLFDVDVDFSDSLALGLIDLVPSGYEPSYFLINGNDYPTLLADSLTAIHETLNDTIIVSIVNSGNIVSSFHFHGFHVTILDAKINLLQIGWLKDSTPFFKGDAVTLMIVADQTGLYPIHAHNLVATTSGGIYPGGMITTIQIDP